MYATGPMRQKWHPDYYAKKIDMQGLISVLVSLVLPVKTEISSLCWGP